MLKLLKDRRFHILVAFIAIFGFLGYSLYDLTIVNGDYYHKRSISNRVKKIEIVPKRGEILDRNGEILATNEVGYSVKLNSALIPYQSFNDIAIKLYEFFDEREEDQLEFPIVIENGQFYYSFDQNIKKWLTYNGYEEGVTARQVLDDMRAANYIDEALSDSEAYRILYNQGKYLPISTRQMLFLEEIYKKNFLKEYSLEIDVSAEEAFKKIRKRSDFHIPDTLSDEDAYKILVLRHAIKDQGFYKYVPITIANSISLETAVTIQERNYEFPGISVDYETVRSYPSADTAAHILGYLGPIATESEIEKYVNGLKYNRNQIIGKTGIEGVYETRLQGERGYKYIEADVYGRYVADVDEKAYGLEVKTPKAGEDVYLTIDLKLQKALEDILERGTKAIQSGSTYKSPWGDYKYEAYPNAETAAGVVVDVKTGEVLAMASYPAYDVNLFAKGISQESWNNLNPVNKRNPLVARPLYNTATMMAVQPGSVYKMMTGYAALEQGLNPAQKLYSAGHVEIGNQRFGCWLWNDYGRVHGPTDLYKALEVSCNYYFFNISTGKDYYRNGLLNFDMNASILTASSEQFGFDEKTGLQIPEVNFGLPDPDRKKRTIEALLGARLRTELKKYFPEEQVTNEESLNELVATIVGWSDENPSRGKLIDQLIELGSNPDYTVTEDLADLIKYDYFNLMKWYESDTLNLSIGQGDHAYTPVQIARYVMAIANGGYLHELSLVKQVGEEKIQKTPDTTTLDEEGYLKHIQQGMYQVTKGTQSSSRRIFEKFPVDVAGKTGTAQKEGLIPPLDEVAYLTEYLDEFAPELDVETVEAETLRILKARSEELAELEKLKLSAETEEEKEKYHSKFDTLINRDYLNKGSAMRAAIKSLSGGTLTDEMINRFRLPYDNYSWFVGYAPYDKPEVAVVVMIPQGGSGTYSAPLVRDILAAYFELEAPSENSEK